MHRRRFLQVSIRTLFIVTTLAAVGCAYWTRVAQRVKQQRFATARILQLGGKVETRSNANVSPWLKKATGEECFQDVVVVDLYSTLATDQDLALLGSFHRLESLTLSGVFPRNCGNVPPPPHNPKGLGAQITDEGIRQLGHQDHLLNADLARTPLTDEAMVTVGSWTQLKELYLSNTKVSSSGIARLLSLERLQELGLQETSVDDEAVDTLVKFRRLQKLFVESTPLSGEGMLRLKEGLPQCQLYAELLDLSSGIDPDPDSMRWKEITRHLWMLSRANQLKLLILSGTAATDKHLMDLDRLETTELIDLRRTKVTQAGVEYLHRMLPDCKVLF